MNWARLYQRFEQSPVWSWVWRTLRLPRVVNAFLRRVPLRRTHGAFRWRARDIESFILAHEILGSPMKYDVSLFPSPIRTFIDLGCHAGYFTGLLQQISGSTCRGLMVDANPDMIREAEWHIRENGWEGVRAIWGLAGNSEAEGDAPFFIHRCSVCSSLYTNASWFEDKPVRELRVPSLRVGALWEAHYPGLTVDLLKVDIEGAELTFIKNEQELLKRTRTILLEWHTYACDLSEIDSMLEGLGFVRGACLEKEKEVETYLYTRDASAISSLQE